MLSWMSCGIRPGQLTACPTKPSWSSGCSNKMPSEKLTYLCTRETFKPLPHIGVRWLAPQADYYRYEQMLLTRGVTPPAYDTWLEWHTQGYGFAAYVRQGIVLSVAAV